MNVENALLALGLHPIPELMALRQDVNYEALCLALHCSDRYAILGQVARHGLRTQVSAQIVHRRSYSSPIDVQKRHANSAIRANLLQYRAAHAPDAPVGPKLWWSIRQPHPR